MLKGISQLLWKGVSTYICTAYLGRRSTPVMEMLSMFEKALSSQIWYV